MTAFLVSAFPSRTLRAHKHNILVTLAILMCSLCKVFAQVGSSDLVGTVADSTGAVIMDASVTVHNIDTAADRTEKTNGKGDYTFSLLPNGRYSLKVEMNGLKTYTVPMFALTAGSRLRIDPKMDVGSVTESANVSAGQEALQTDSSSVTSVVDERTVQDIPLNNRNFAGALALQPGVILSTVSANLYGVADRRPSTDVIVNGQLPAYNNNLIDGFDNNERNNGLAGVRPSIDGIAEMIVDSSVYRAEVGRAGGAAINLITKSGTNKFHGSVFEYFRNDLFDARNYFATVAAGPKPEFRQNIFGGSVGGPIYKNKTFFFFDFEEGRMIQGQTSTVSIPTLYEEQHPGDFSDITICYGAGGGPPPPPGSPTGCQQGFVLPGNQLSTIATNLWALVPAPNLPGITNYNGIANQTPLNNYTSSNPLVQNTRTYSVRIDHRFSDNNLFFARYANNPVYTYFPGIFPEVDGIFPGGNNNNFPGPSNSKSQNVQLDFVHLFTPKLLVDLKAAYSRINISTFPLNYGAGAAAKLDIPNVLLPGNPTTDVLPIFDLGTFQLGSSNGVPSISINNNFQYSGSVTYTRGTHDFKVGAGLIRRQLLDFTNQEGGGAFPVNGNVAPYTDFGQFLIGSSTVELRSIDLFKPGFRAWEPSFYAQDDWRANAKLTLNYGLRYEVFTPWIEAHGRQSNFDLSTLNFILGSQDPHIGVKTDYKDFGPRLGFAYSIDSKTVVRGGYGLSWYPLEVGSSSAGSSPSNLIANPNPPYVFTYVNTPPNLNSFVNGPVLPAPIDLSTFTQNSQITSINIRPKNSRPIQVSQMNLTVQRQFGNYTATLGYVGVLSNRLGRGINADAPDPPGANQPEPAYVYAKQLPYVQSLGEVYNGSSGSYHGFHAIFSRQFRNDFQVNANYTFAHGLDNTSPGAAAIVTSSPDYDYGNSAQDVRHSFNFSTNYSLPIGESATGFKAVLLKGWQANAIYIWRTGLPFTVSYTAHPVVPVNVPGLSSDRPDVIKNPVLPNASVSEWFDTTAFENQTLGTAGDSRKNSLFGPHYRSADVSALKNFAIKDSLNLQFRAECFNLSNTPNLGQPDGILGDSTFGVISSTVGNPRQFQFALKLIF